MDALEFEHEPNNERERDVVNLHVECAAQLFIYAAGELYRRCKDGYSEPLRPISTRESKVKALWHDGNEDEGYSEERWGFWKERRGAISTGGGQGLSDEAYVAAKKALEAMEEVER